MDGGPIPHGRPSDRARTHSQWSIRIAELSPSHRGSISTPYAAQAAFNSHSKKPRPPPPLPPELHPTGFAARQGDNRLGMKLSAVSAITNNLVAARFWMLAAITFAALAAVAPYLTVRAMKQKEKVVILDPGGTMMYSPLLGFEEAGQLHAYHVRLACLALFQRNPVGPDLPDLLKRIYLEPARKKAAAMYQTRNEEFAEKQIHQKVEITKIDILDSRKINDSSGQTYEAVRSGPGEPDSHRNRQQAGVPRAGEIPDRIAFHPKSRPAWQRAAAARGSGIQIQGGASLALRTHHRNDHS